MLNRTRMLFNVTRENLKLSIPNEGVLLPILDVLATFFEPNVSRLIMRTASRDVVLYSSLESLRVLKGFIDNVTRPFRTAQ